MILLLVAPAVGAACGDGVTDGDRPRVGLALSGGGARGVAHLGVLRGLEALGVPIDCVAGTSMGAVVGGLYASGLPLSRVESLLLERDWGALFADRTAFRQLAFRRKQVQRRYRFGVRLGLGKGGIRLPTGLSPGQQLGAILQSHLIHATDDFDQLPVPFRAVATDIVTGERVVLGAGNLAHAIQASATLPGVLAPLEIDGRLLVDGGLVDNLPVDVVRGMGADVVIAVDISEPLYRRDQIDSLVAITWQVVGIQTRGNMVSQLAAADLVLVPELDGFTSGSFDQVAVMVTRGDDAVTAATERLRPWLAEQADAPASVVADTAPAPTIRAVRFEGLDQVDERRLSRRLACLPGDTLDVGVLQQDAAALFATDRFERVGVRSEPESDGVAVIYDVLERQDTMLVRTDVRLGADSKGETDFRALASIARVDLNARGGIWRTDLWVGEPRGVMTTLHQPIDFAGRYFVAPSLRVSQDRQDVYRGDDKQAEYKVAHRRFTLDVGRQWGRFGELRLGWVRGHTDAEDIVGASGLETRDDAVGGAHASVRLDTTDDRSFPRRGLSLDASLFWSHRDLGADRAYRRAHVDALYFVPVGEAHTLLAGVSGGRRLGDDRLPADTQFQLGGIFSLGGYPVGRFRGDAAATARLGGFRQLARLPPGLGGRIVGGVVAEWGMAWRQPEDARFADLRLGLTAFMGADTLLGPLLIGYGWAEDGNDRFYVALGHGIR